MDNITLGALKDIFLQEDPALVLPKGLGAPISYRGFYDQVAFLPIAQAPVQLCLNHIEEALQREFQGYKGGNYRYKSWTPVWFVEHASDYGGECALLDTQVRAWIQEAKGALPSEDRRSLCVNIRKPYRDYVAQETERKDLSNGRLIELALALYQKHEAGLLVDTSLPGGCAGED